MATVAAPSSSPLVSDARLPGRRYDHVYFTTSALCMLATILVGFGRTYFFAGMFHAPLPSAIIHVHGALFTSWILLLVTQTSLVSAGQVRVHRRLGIAGFFLGCLMVPIGVLAATDSLVRHTGSVVRDSQAFYIVPLSDLVIFAPLLFLAFRARRDAPAHKRYIYVATVSLLIAAIARIPEPIGRRGALVAGWESYVFVLALMAYDLWSTHKIHRVTIWASALLIFVQNIRFPIASTGAWHSIAAWVQMHAR